MSAETSGIEPTCILNIPSDSESTLASLFAAMESVVPGSDENARILDDAHELARLIDELGQDSLADNNDISAQVGRHLHTQKSRLSPQLKIRLLFWQTFFDVLEKKSPLDERLLAELQRLRPTLVMLALRDQHLVTDTQQAFRQFLDRVLHEGAFWYPQSGKEGAVFLETLVQAVGMVIAAAKTPDTTPLKSIAENFVTLVDKQKTRAGMMEQRCGESELGMAKIHRAQIKVIQLLDSLNGCVLPETVLGFVRTILKGELQFILINQGETADAWQSWSAIIKRLPQVFPLAFEGEKSVEPEPPNRQQLYRDVQIIVGLLDEHVTVSAAQQQSYDDGVEDFRERLFEKLRGINPPLATFLPLTVPDELSRIGAAVSPSLIKKASGLQVGDWFLFSNSDNQLVRCKLLLRPPEIEQLLFVNRSGHRVLQKSVQDFSACLATRIAIPLAIESYFDRALALTVEKLRVWVDKNKTLMAQVKAQQILEEVEESRVASEELAPAESNSLIASPESSEFSDIESTPEHVESLQSEVDAAQKGSPASDRKSAAQKALQEARVLEKLEVRRERQRNQIDSAATTQDTLGAVDSTDNIHQQIASLNPGAWVELPQTDSETLLRCKLVAIMRSSNTYIFTDRRGVKVAEYERATLVSLLACNNARIISNGDDFEGQLSKVVLTLRRDT